MSSETSEAREKAEPEAAPTTAEWVAFWEDQPAVSGSKRGDLTAMLTSRLAGTLWYGREPKPAMVEVQQRAAVQAVAGIGPRDVVEGMLAAQMVATHEAAMECFRRAHLPEQNFEGRALALNHATKLVRAFAALSEALDRHRGKGQPQVVRVERVTVEAGGQAIVGTVGQGGGGGGHDGSEERPYAKQQRQQQRQQQRHQRRRLGHAPEPALRGADAAGEPVPVAGGGGEAALPDARRRQGQRRA
jgi:hypothetical protein